MLVLDAHVALVQAAELEGTEVDVPDTIIDFLKADVFFDADDRDMDPVAAQADAAVDADVAHLESAARGDREDSVSL